MCKRALICIVMLLFVLSTGKATIASSDFADAVLGENIPRAMELVREGADVNQYLGNRQTALHFTVRYHGLTGGSQDYRDFLMLLLDSGADVNLKDSEGLTSLHYAVLYSPDLVLLLIDKGALINARDNLGFTPLHLGREVNTARQLLERGALVNEVNNMGHTPLISVVLAGSGADVVAVMLDFSARVNAKDNEGYTALHYAADRGDRETVRILLNNGANMNSRANNGATPLYLARKQNHDRIVQLLTEEGAEVTFLNSLFLSLQKGPFVPVVFAMLFLGWAGFVVKQTLSRRRALTALLVTVTALGVFALFYGLLLPGKSPIAFVFIPPLSVLFSTALAGALAIRFLKAQWPEPLLAVLPAATVAAGITMFVNFSYQGFASYLRSLASGLGVIALASAGMFLLPLLDPKVREKGPAPPPWKVCAGAAAAILAVVGLDLFREISMSGYWNFFGLYTLIAGSGLALIITGAGVVLTLFKKIYQGALVGATGIVMWGFVLLVWILTGTPWFP